MPDENQSLQEAQAKEELADEMIQELHRQKIPNAETQAAMDEAREMVAIRFKNAEELFSDLEKFNKLEKKILESKK